MSRDPHAARRARALPRSQGPALLLAVLLATVLLPFAFFGVAVEAWTATLIRSPGAAAITGAVGAGLLAADIVLPIPSSVVLTALGVALGGVAGAMVGAAGLTFGCVVGYGLGRAAGKAGATSLLAGSGDASVQRLLKAYGLPLVVACRAVPVLAEASIIAAGIAGLPPLRCLSVAALANIGLAAAYASIGAWSADATMLGLGFAASVGLPGLAMAVAAWLRRRAEAGTGTRQTSPSRPSSSVGEASLSTSNRCGE
jgi:uncharacterized membrane protein YdjX (TVP38/TMEM64 family)